MIQSYRLVVRVVSLLVLIMTPILTLYRTTLNYVPRDYIGHLSQYAGHLSEVIPLDKTGGYLSWLLISLDWVVGISGISISSIRSFLSNINGSFWSITISGITITDPLALMQSLASGQPISLPFAIAAVIPIILALIFGRFFCSWICPVSTVNDFIRLIIGKLKLPYIKKPFITNQHLNFYLLIAGLVMPFLGLIVFPYIIPYVLMGRFFYSLALGRVLWEALIFLLLLMTIDALIQRGFWCNYLCPSGFLLALLGKRRLVNIKYNDTLCRKGCSHCKHSCSWQADPRVKYSLNCTNCGECIERCPSGALGFTKPDLSGHTKYKELA